MLDAGHSGTSQRMVHHKNTQHNTTTTQCNDTFTGLTDDNRVKAGRAGAIDVITSAMKTHSNNAGVCEQGCRTLNNITYNNVYCGGDFNGAVKSIGNVIKRYKTKARYLKELK